MHILRFESPQAFAARVAPFLLRHEAAHNLLLGVPAELRQFPQIYPGPNYFAAVEQGGEVLLAALLTPPHALQLSLAPEPAAVELVAHDLLGSPLAPSHVSGPADVSRAFAEAWRALTGQGARRSLALRIYRLEQVRPPAGVPGQMRRAAWGDVELLARWLEGFQQDTHGASDPASARRAAERWLSSPVRTLYLWEDGEPAALAGVGGPTPNGMRVSAVYTPPERRRRGYASALVAAASQAVLDSGRAFAFLFTDLANPTSNHIYQQIGYEPVCDVDEYRLGDR